MTTQAHEDVRIEEIGADHADLPAWHAVYDAAHRSELGEHALVWALPEVSTFMGEGSVGRRRVFPLPIVLLIAGVALTLAEPLALVAAGIGVVTIGFFGAHAIASAWVGRRAAAARGQGAAWYLFAYYAGSSLLGSAGGVAWARDGWPGVVAFCLVLGALALAGAALLARVAPVAADYVPVAPEA